MLYVVLNSGTSAEKEIRWNVGSQFNLQSTDLMDVDLVQADGDELDFVKSNCNFLKVGNGRVEKFTNDDAMGVAAILLART